MAIRLPPPPGRYRYIAQLLALDNKRPSAAWSVPASIAGVSSPLSLNLREWQKRLLLHPDQEFAEYILGGLERGFRVGFDYSSLLHSARRNMPSAVEHLDLVERYLGEEPALGRIL